jgi:hypothetical protein
VLDDFEEFFAVVAAFAAELNQLGRFAEERAACRPLSAPLDHDARDEDPRMRDYEERGKISCMSS